MVQLLQNVANIRRSRFELAAVNRGGASVFRHQFANPMGPAAVQDPEQMEDTRMRREGKAVAVGGANDFVITAGRPENRKSLVRRHAFIIR